MMSARLRNRSRIAVAVGTSPTSFPHSSSGLFEVMIVDLSWYRRMMILKRYSPACFCRLMPERLGQMRFADAGRAREEDIPLFPNEPARGQFHDLSALYGRI